MKYRAHLSVFDVCICAGHVQAGFRTSLNPGITHEMNEPSPRPTHTTQPHHQQCKCGEDLSIAFPVKDLYEANERNEYRYNLIQLTLEFK